MAMFLDGVTNVLSIFAKEFCKVMASAKTQKLPIYQSLNFPSHLVGFNHSMHLSK